MLTINKILFPTDFSTCAEHAFDEALALAKAYDAELHMLNAIKLSDEIPSGMFDFYGPRLNSPGYYPVDDTLFTRELDKIHHRLKKNAEERMDEWVSSSKAKGAKIHRIALEGIVPAQVIIDYATEHDIDLIVMGTHGRRGLKHLLLGSVAEEVVQRAVCSVYTVREKSETPPKLENRNILVPLDFSEFSQEALAYAVHLAGAFNGQLQLLHVVERYVTPEFYGPEPYISGESKDITTLEAEALAELQKLFVENHANAVSHGCFVKSGHVTKEILRFADENHSDLIVMATHGLTGLDHFLMGSVAEKIVRQAPCPVFTLKSFGRGLLTSGKSSKTATAK